MGNQNRSGGFLQPKERAYLEDVGWYPGDTDDPPERPSNTKSRIRNQVMTVDSMEQIIEGFNDDLLALTMCAPQLGDSDGREWENVTLRSVKPQLEELRDLINTLIAKTESDDEFHTAQQIVDALDPLYPGGFESYTKAIKDPDRTAEERVQLSEEKQDRFDALMKVLENKELLKILEYLGEHDKAKISDKNYGKKSWAWAASNEMSGLVTVDREAIGDPEYELSERGEAVLDAWQSLQNKEPVRIRKQAAPDMETREIVKNILTFFNQFEKQQ